MARQEKPARWADSPLCLNAVNVGTANRKHGCPCALPPQHGVSDHRCACGATWNLRGEATTRPPYPAICGWSFR